MFKIQMFFEHEAAENPLISKVLGYIGLFSMNQQANLIGGVFFIYNTTVIGVVVVLLNRKD